LKSLSYLALYEVVRTNQTFPPIFRIFAIFDRNFAKIVAPPSDENENYVMHLKDIYSEKRSENGIKINL